MIGYAAAGLRALRRHRGWLLARRSDLAAVRRVRAVLIAYAAIVTVRTGYLIADALIAPLSYFDMFGFYVVLAVVGNYLAIEGWRQADARPQPIVEQIERDWRPIAAGWMDRIEEHGWWRDPDLDLAEPGPQAGEQHRLSVARPQRRAGAGVRRKRSTGCASSMSPPACRTVPMAIS
ncbi:hypothetical protein QP162_22495 [Sphingomonas aurantiaca]|uniref:hypothetical protein n=1 Tax=Sphingomonas aurantiaca TaxID=185949 RepID=UPI002FE00DFF